MIIIHRITAMVPGGIPNMDPFYVRYPDPSKVAPHVNFKGINFTAVPLRVHEDPEPDAEYASGHRIWHLTGENLYFTTGEQAEKVFMVLYGRMPDLGTELRSVELTQPTNL